jgi:hypothetical protein
VKVEAKTKMGQPTVRTANTKVIFRFSSVAKVISRGGNPDDLCRDGFAFAAATHPDFQWRYWLLVVIGETISRYSL